MSYVVHEIYGDRITVRIPELLESKKKINCYSQNPYICECRAGLLRSGFY